MLKAPADGINISAGDLFYVFSGTLRPTAESSALYAIGILVLVGTAKGIVEALRLIYLGFFLTAQAGKLVIILIEQLLELVAVAEDTCRAFSV